MGLIVILAVGMALAGSVRGLEATYGRVHSDVNRDSYAAKRAFDAVVRRSCRLAVLPSPFPVNGSSWIEVYYYASATSTFADRYARFFVDNGELKIEEGVVDANKNKLSVLTTFTVCSNIESCVFRSYGRSIQMMLTLDSGTQSATVVSSAVLHNP